MKQLTTLIQDQEKRRVVVEDCADLVDSEVRSKKGVSGALVKTSYKLVKTFKPNAIQDAVDGLLDDFVARLQVFYEGYQQEGSPGTLESYLQGRSDAVAESLLEVTDERARESSAKTLVKAYNRLRPKAKEHVILAVPQLGALLDKHAASL